MLFWICPECGRECSPRVRECPACTQTSENVAPVPAYAAETMSVTDGILAMAETLQEAHQTAEALVPAQVAASSLNGAAANGHPTQLTILDAATATEDDSRLPVVELPSSETIDSLVRSLVESAAAPESEPEEAEQLTMDPAPPEPSAIPEPVLDTAATAAAIEQLASEWIEDPVAATLLEPPAVVAETFAPVDTAIEQLADEQLAAIEAAAHPDPLPASVEPETAAEGSETLAARAMELQAEVLVDAIAEKLQVRESGIRQIVTSFQHAPAAVLLAAPRDILTEPAPPDVQWRRTPRPSIPAAKPRHAMAAVQMFGPQPLTLAGPSLPIQLRTFTEERTETQLYGAKRASLPSWVVSLVVATCLFLGAGSVMQFLTGRREPHAAAAQSTASASNASPAAAVEQHPFSRFIEVTGIRVVADLSRKAQVQYIVVNHSSISINNASIRLAVHSAAESSGAAPLFTVSAVVSLAPYQSKEIRTDLDSQLRSTAIPEWDNLRPDVQVSVQQ